MTLHITGITELDRADSDGSDSRQEIVVRDRADRIHLSMLHSAYGARLTIDQAQALALLLIEARIRLEQRLSPDREPSDV
jgi:hypothetical protein